ncbi:predicted protein [Botrytis cinerea T4]|uniref:Uncharacterized protein n=1 Tax=Botryotinia fuckeliana (strain T4) TaxID=999810 RepID=G2YL64_BOTF4|nr:predicted protein [Botrytis cinerea T4]
MYKISRYFDTSYAQYNTQVHEAYDVHFSPTLAQKWAGYLHQSPINPDGPGSALVSIPTESLGRSTYQSTSSLENSGEGSFEILWWRVEFAILYKSHPARPIKVPRFCFVLVRLKIP